MKGQTRGIKKAGWAIGAIVAAGLIMALVMEYWQMPGGKPMLLKTPEPESASDLVLLSEHIPGLHIDLRYAGYNNVFEKPVTVETQAALRAERRISSKKRKVSLKRKDTT